MSGVGQRVAILIWNENEEEDCKLITHIDNINEKVKKKTINVYDHGGQTAAHEPHSNTF